MTRLFIIVVSLAILFKLPVKQTTINFRDAFSLIVLLMSVVIDDNRTYTLTLLVGFIIFSIIIFIDNILREVLLKDEWRKDEEINKYVLIITSMRNRIDVLEKELARRNTYTEDDRSRLRSLIINVYKEMGGDSVRYTEILNILKDLESYLEKPITLVKERNIFDTPRSKRMLKLHIDLLGEILETYNLGPSFDKAIEKEIERLESIIEDGNSDRIDN